MGIAELREEFHRRICSEIIRLKQDGASEYPNFADKASKASRAFAVGIIKILGHPLGSENISGQSSGSNFEAVTKDFLENSFGLLQHVRPGRWYYSVRTSISDFDQYGHLANLDAIVKQTRELSTSLGTDYIVKPDIVIGRFPLSDDEINIDERIVSDRFVELSPLREVNLDQPRIILHASVSCKWTLRSDRGQNARTEALNLIRNRKGNLPHVVAVTAEPLPTRIASLALGTGDLDCVYHFALPELVQAIKDANNEDQLDMLQTLIAGRRLRDISDLPFDLAI